MNLLKRIHKLFDRLVDATYYYVTFDICPDFNTGQSEMCSYIIKAPNQDQAVIWAKAKAMTEWEVSEEAIWLVDCVQTHDDELIYNS